MFRLGARAYLDELGRFRPDILDATRRAWDKRATDLDFLRLDAEAFASCPSDSIDFAVMEKTDRAAVLPIDIGWSDVGSWTTLWEVGSKDNDGNVTRGDVHLRDADCRRAERRWCPCWPEERDRGRDRRRGARRRPINAQAVADIGHLDDAKRSEHVSHSRVYRPWAGTNHRRRRPFSRRHYGEARALPRCTTGPNTVVVAAPRVTAATR
jgi:hypothetical protein